MLLLKTIKRFKLSLFFIIGLIILSACSHLRKNHILWQNAPAISLNNGQYDGLTPVKEIKAYGNQGVGAWDKLDGEGVIIDGQFYKIHASGEVEKMPDEATMAWAVVTFFEAQTQSHWANTGNYSALADKIDATLPSLNTHYALRITGEFNQLTTRSLPKQSKPYPPLCEVTAQQPEFHFERIHGTMVGFRSPGYVDNFGVPGWHLHFLSDDKQHGGHVLSFANATVDVAIDRLNHLHIETPNQPAFNQADLQQPITCDN